MNEPTGARGRGSRRRRWGRRGVILLLLLVGGLVAARLALPSFLQWYVSRTIDQSPLYDGRVGDVDVHLWRGAYSIQDVRISKVTGNVPVPLYAADRVDLAIQWDALLHGRVVGRIAMLRPELNFVDGESDAEDQTGAGGGPWLDIIEDLFPFRINSATVRDGTIHFRAFHTDPPVDLALTEVHARVENLTNITDDITPLNATVEARALALDHAELEYEMRLDPFSYRPTFQMALRLIALDVTKTNALTRAYGAFDFEHGWFDLVIELEATEGRLEGYVKPMFRDVKVLSLEQDLAEDDVLRVFWEALVGGVSELLENQPRDQFATRIPLRGDLTGPDTDVLTVLGNVLRNAFIRAYLPRLEGVTPDISSLQFGPAEITDPVNAGTGP